MATQALFNTISRHLRMKPNRRTALTGTETLPYWDLYDKQVISGRNQQPFWDRLSL